MEEPFVYKIYIREQGAADNGEVTDPYLLQRSYEQEVEEQIWLGKNGLAGDGKHDPEQAAFVYPLKHYTYWKEQLATESLELGVIGENFSVLEMDEFSVCIGDTYQFGDAIIQVSEPRLPSWHIAQRLQNPDFALNMQNSGRTGWHVRVLQEGNVLSRIDIELIDRPYPEWTIAACNEVMHVDKHNLRLADELMNCDLLSIQWRKILQLRLRGIEPSEQERLYGPNK